MEVWLDVLGSTISANVGCCDRIDLFQSGLLKSAFLHLSASNPPTLMAAHPDSSPHGTSWSEAQEQLLRPSPVKDLSMSSRSVSINSLKVKTQLQSQACKLTPCLESKVVWGGPHRFWSAGSLGRRFMEVLRMWRPALFLALVLPHLRSEGKTSRINLEN